VKPRCGHSETTARLRRKRLWRVRPHKVAYSSRRVILISTRRFCRCLSIPKRTCRHCNAACRCRVAELSVGFHRHPWPPASRSQAATAFYHSAGGFMAFKIGFRDPAYFSRLFKKYLHNAGAAHRPAREKSSQPISKKLIASRRHLPENAGFSAALRWLHIASADSLYS
jgi:hypothetical protein